jgi:hypothetical protein
MGILQSFAEYLFQSFIWGTPWDYNRDLSDIKTRRTDDHRPTNYLKQK